MTFKPWLLPVIVAAIVVPISVGFIVAGPPLGLALGALAAGVLALFATLQRPGGLIETKRSNDGRRRVLVVVSRELDDPRAVERIKEERDLGSEPETEILLLAPAQARLLDLWATDVGPARAEAQRKLVISAAELGKAHVAARAVVGDHDIVRAVEDQLRSFAADEIVLVTGQPDDDVSGERAAHELERRLNQRFVRIVVG
jgi:hypothetical protein